MKKNIRFVMYLHFRWPFSYILIWPFTSMEKKSYYASRNLKKVEEIKVLSDEKLFKDQQVVYESSYNSKVYKNGKLVNNKVRYKKIKL
ncbi:hypothetical protein HMPREF0556_10452 [Listeria grayi DSM 20601]|uniref:Uncharacterized protein n=1 Tax=Listeria grayi DSM 20601 TaxID=525367 RepID=D7UUE6_LISGR|nr:hypothetical protein HMPREF0556_10452 [Listeria grayi DSM 20601]